MVVFSLTNSPIASVCVPAVRLFNTNSAVRIPESVRSPALDSIKYGLPLSGRLLPSISARTLVHSPASKPECEVNLYSISKLNGSCLATLKSVVIASDMSVMSDVFTPPTWSSTDPLCKIRFS